MSHQHRDYLDEHLATMRRVHIDLAWQQKTAPTQLLNGEGFALWYVITKNVQRDILCMSLNGMSEATGLSVQNIRKRLAAFIQAGWLIERGYEKVGKYAETKTYDVVLDVLGVGHLTHSPDGSQGGSHSGSQGGSHSGSHSGSRNTANPTQESETMPNPIPNTNPTPTARESANNNGNTPSKKVGAINTRTDTIVAMCIELERRNTSQPIGKPLETILRRDYAPLVAAELQCREWLTDGATADVCYAKRNGKQPPTYTRPTCRTCGNNNKDEHGRSQICQTNSPPYIYIVCPKCDGDGFQPLSDVTRSMFTNLNNKGNQNA